MAQRLAPARHIARREKGDGLFIAARQLSARFRDARAIQTGKRETEQEQRVTFEDARRAPATPPPAAEPVEVVNEE